MTGEPEASPRGEYRIREGVPEDAEAARRMQADAWRATYPNQQAGVSRTWVEEETAKWLTAAALTQSRAVIEGILRDERQFYRVAECGDRLVGFVHALRKDDGTVELQAVYTAPDTFGSGLGEQLLRQAIDDAAGAAMGLSVASYNQRAIRFYEKHGFRVVPGSEALYREVVPLIRMRRPPEERLPTGSSRHR